MAPTIELRASPEPGCGAQALDEQVTVGVARAAASSQPGRA